MFDTFINQNNTVAQVPQRFQTDPKALEDYEKQLLKTEEKRNQGLETWLNNTSNATDKQQINYYFGTTIHDDFFVRTVINKGLTRKIHPHAAFKTAIAGGDLIPHIPQGQIKPTFVPGWRTPNLVARLEEGVATVLYSLGVEFGHDVSSLNEQARRKNSEKGRPIIDKVIIEPAQLTYSERSRLEAIMDKDNPSFLQAVLQQSGKGEANIIWRRIWEDHESGELSGFQVQLTGRLEGIRQVGMRNFGFAKLLDLRTEVLAKISIFHPNIEKLSPSVLLNKAQQALHAFFKTKRYQPPLLDNDGDPKIAGQNYRTQLLFGMSPWQIAANPGIKNHGVGAISVAQQIQQIAEDYDLLKEGDIIKDNQQASDILHQLELQLKDKPEKLKHAFDTAANPYDLSFGSQLLEDHNRLYFEDNESVRPSDYQETRDFFVGMYRHPDDVNIKTPTRLPSRRLFKDTEKTPLKPVTNDANLLHNFRVFKNDNRKKEAIALAKQHIDRIAVSQFLTKYLVDTGWMNSLLTTLRDKGRIHSYNQLLTQIQNYPTTQYWADLYIGGGRTFSLIKPQPFSIPTYQGAPTKLWQKSLNIISNGRWFGANHSENLETVESLIQQVKDLKNKHSGNERSLKIQAFSLTHAYRILGEQTDKSARAFRLALIQSELMEEVMDAFHQAENTSLFPELMQRLNADRKHNIAIQQWWQKHKGDQHISLLESH